jgi:hypothetical protein
MAGVCFSALNIRARFISHVVMPFLASPSHHLFDWVQKYHLASVHHLYDSSLRLKFISFRCYSIIFMPIPYLQRSEIVTMLMMTVWRTGTTALSRTVPRSRQVCRRESN